jgi:outer membrane protein assembly factor BamE
MPRALTLALVLLLGACALPDFMAPYRIDIQQGNYVTQEMVSQLKPGMSKEQVRYLLGTPLLTDIFHAERWDYVYWFDRRGQPLERRRLAVFFQEGKLARLDGDVVTAGEKKGEIQ